MSHIDGLDINQPITIKDKASTYFEDFLFRIVDALDPLTYETGTWTPELWDSSFSTDPTPPTYTEQVGVYTKVGDLVHIQGRVSTSSIGGLTPADSIVIGGLPFISITHSPDLVSTAAISIGWGSGLNISTGNKVSAFIDFGKNHASLAVWDVSTGSTRMLVSEFSSNGDIMFSGTYKANA